jgi:hypothetical protein
LYGPQIIAERGLRINMEDVPMPFDAHREAKLRTAEEKMAPKPVGQNPGPVKTNTPATRRIRK